MSGDMARDVSQPVALDTEQLMISLAGAAMANDAMASSSGEDDGFTGDPTEVALVVAAEESGLHKAVLDKVSQGFSRFPSIRTENV